MRYDDLLKKIPQPQAGRCDVCDEQVINCYVDATTGLKFGKCCLQAMRCANHVMCFYVLKGAFCHPCDAGATPP